MCRPGPRSVRMTVPRCGTTARTVQTWGSVMIAVQGSALGLWSPLVCTTTAPPGPRVTFTTRWLTTRWSSTGIW